MQIVYLGIVFAVIIILLACKRPLYQAILGGLLATILFYRIPPMEIVQRTLKTLTTFWNPGRSAAYGISDVRGSCSQSDFTDPCVPGGGIRLFSCNAW